MSAKRREVKLPSGRRLDEVPRKDTAVEIERSPDPRRLELAARRLKESRRPRKVLRVPTGNMDKAVKAMRKVGIGGSVTNLSKTRRRGVPKER